MVTVGMASLYTMRLPTAVSAAVALIMAVAAGVVLRLPSQRRAGREHLNFDKDRCDKPQLPALTTPRLGSTLMQPR